MSRRSLSSLVALVLLLGQTPCLLAASTERQSEVQPMSKGPSLASCSRAVSAEHNHPAIPDNLTVQRIGGEEALTYLQQLEAKNPSVFSEVRRSLRGRGYEPTRTVSVSRTVATPGLISDSASSSDGEIVMWSWDDGDDGTWEGMVYVKRYSDGATATSEGQMDITVPEVRPIWYRTISIDRPGDDEPRPAGFGAGWSTAEVMSHAVIQPGQSMSGVYAPASDGFDWFTWMVCSVDLCYICMEGCTFAGQYWGHCTLACCSIAMILCGVAVY